MKHRMNGASPLVCILLLVLCRIIYGGPISPSDDFGAAIAAATPGEVFTLSAGTYTITATILIPNSISIEGVGTSTIIQCTSRVLGFQSDKSDVTLSQVTIQGCGTVIFLTGGTLKLSDATFQNNVNSTTSGFGGCITSVDSRSVVLSRVSIFGSIGGYGGGIAVTNVSNFTATDSVFYNNTAIKACGALFIQSSNFMMSNCTINQNTAESDNAGGMCVLYGSNGILQKSAIYNNTAHFHGGGISVQTAKCNIIDSSLYKNVANDGGGIFIYQESSVTLENVRCYGNSALKGGCIYSDATTNTTVKDSNLTSNTVQESAGGIYVNGYCFVYNCTIASNFVNDLFFGKGGGIYSDSQTNALELDFSSVVSNFAIFGGGVYLDNLQKGLLANNNITANGNDDFYIVPAQTSTFQMIHTNVAIGRSTQSLNMCCGNTTYASPYPTGLHCSYPICESCINGCNCPEPITQINSTSNAYTSVNTTCSYESCDSEMASDCDENAFCTVFPDRVSHNCTCKSGYSGNGSFCQDINECEPTSPCNTLADCINTNGSFECQCHGGYSGDGFNCSDINECAAPTFPCPEHADCQNTLGYFTCTCRTGFFMNGTGCGDVDECGSGYNNDCSPYASCFNTYGSYNCSCREGFTGNGTNCTDVDECATAISPCPVNATCGNTIGHFYCNCSSGFVGNGTDCQDINECAVGFNNNCSELANCSNTYGSYQCECLGGYTGDGYICTDVDECNALTSPCPQNADCTNVPGKFLCDCSAGFYGNGTECGEIIYSKGLSIGLGIIVGICLTLAIFAALLLATNWDLFTRMYGSFYCAIVITGVVLAEASAVLQLPKQNDTLCVAFPWLLGTGFTLVYGCLFIKTSMLFRIWSNAMKLKRVYITAFTVVRYVGFALCVEIFFLIIWTVVDPPKVHIVSVINDKFQSRCESRTRIFWIIFLALKGVWLLFGAGIAVITRKVLKQYTEFSSIVYAVYNNLILMAIAIPLALLLWDVPNGTLVITVIVIVLAFTFTLFILFFDVWTQVLFPHFADVSLDSVPSSTPSVHSDIGSAHETIERDTHVEVE